MTIITPAFSRRWPSSRPQTMAAFGIFGHLGRWPRTPEDGHPVTKMAIHLKPVSPYIYRRYLYMSEDGHPRYRGMALFGMEQAVSA